MVWGRMISPGRSPRCVESSRSEGRGSASRFASLRSSRKALVMMVAQKTRGLLHTGHKYRLHTREEDLGFDGLLDLFQEKAGLSKVLDGCGELAEIDPVPVVPRPVEIQKVLHIRCVLDHIGEKAHVPKRLVPICRPLMHIS